MPPRRLLLADCDQMFVAVARLVDPAGAGRAPLLVVGGRSRSRGVVCSASWEARAFGLRAGMPIARAARLCPGAMFVPVPRQACGVKHREIRAVLDEWTPLVEPASIDEFYLDFTGTERLYRDESLEATAERLREAVRVRTGITLSIGGGTNRLVAKLAAERAKPRPGTGARGVLVVPPGGEAEFLASHELGEIPGVGPRLQAALRRYGLVSVRDALRVERHHLERWFGPRTGAWLHDRIRGLGSDLVDPAGEAKSLGHEETFARDLVGDEALETRLLRLVTRLAADLRAEGLAASCVTVKLRDFDFTTRSAARTLPEPVSTDRAIYRTAHDLLAGLRRRRRVAARLLGVTLTRLQVGAEPAQFALLPPAATAEGPRDRALMRAVDRIHERHGEEVLKPARLVRPGGKGNPA